MERDVLEELDSHLPTNIDHYRFELRDEACSGLVSPLDRKTR